MEELLILPPNWAHSYAGAQYLNIKQQTDSKRLLIVEASPESIQQFVIDHYAIIRGSNLHAEEVEAMSDLNDADRLFAVAWLGRANRPINSNRPHDGKSWGAKGPAGAV
jgi:hypothetical protein